ncbi:MAG: response regulator [Candidatus Chloroheliales bacterium]|nr:MAG: response regulator [Chloroflexota bacterium]
MQDSTDRARPIRIVAADDEPLIRMNLRETLNSLGYDVVGEAGDGNQAVKLARELRPDIVIMDIKMPEMDGIEAAHILTSEQVAPVLLLTAYSDRELIERAKGAGVMNYLVKPFREESLAPAIEVTLTTWDSMQQLDQQVDTLQGQLDATQNELGSLREQLEARKMIERAKGLLMQRKGISEQEAFRLVQKRSMDSRKSMREVAKEIIDAYLLTDDLEKQ